MAWSLQQEKRIVSLNLMLAPVPDLLIAGAIAHATETGIIGAVVVLVVLWSLYLLIWLKKTLAGAVWWSWFGERASVDALLAMLAREGYPRNRWYVEFSDYFEHIAEDEAAPVELRLKAANMQGQLEGLFEGKDYFEYARIERAGQQALDRYCGRAERAAAD